MRATSTTAPSEKGTPTNPHGEIVNPVKRDPLPPDERPNRRIGLSRWPKPTLSELIGWDPSGMAMLRDAKRDHPRRANRKRNREARRARARNRRTS